MSYLYLKYSFSKEEKPEPQPYNPQSTPKSEKNNIAPVVMINEKPNKHVDNKNTTYNRNQVPTAWFIRLLSHTPKSSTEEKDPSTKKERYLT
jgi:hypothetical protein